MEGEGKRKLGERDDLENIYKKPKVPTEKVCLKRGISGSFDDQKDSKRSRPTNPIQNECRYTLFGPNNEIDDLRKIAFNIL